ncbi:phage tail length tape measure family protein [Sphingobium sp. WCS2017Hpa-17]|uniref:phage tail length tape measure family protein n=1 Tax=Sphingobium sp. WCS2017Hpa-17 TaxID=3073638 RepID=UPI00288B8D02|nr:phage tail length tape measure family protein [Sphingobium sp. WCS2017Hpa-17]
MDAAALSLNIDSSKVVTAANDLDRFTTSSDRAAAAAAKVNFGNQAGSIAKLVASVQSIDNKLSALISTITKVQQAEKALASANDNSSRSMAVADAHVTAYTQHLAAMVAGTNVAAAAQKGAAADAALAGAAIASADSHVIAYTQHLAALARTQQDANSHVVAWQNRVQAASPAFAQADAHVVAYRNSLGKVAEGANAASSAIKFTAQDTLNASRQLSDIGVTLAMGMNPFMIAIQQGPQLLDILQNKAAMTGQTLGAVFKAAAASIGAALLPLLPIIAILTLAAAGIAALTEQANDDSGLKKYTTAMGYTKEEVKKLNAVTVTLGDTFKAVFQVAWERIASAFGVSTDYMSKKWGEFTQWLVTAIRAGLAGVYAGLTGASMIIPRLIENIKTGRKENLFELIGGSFKDQYAQAQKFMDDVVGRARKNAQGRQNAMAAAMYDKPSTPKGGKSDAEKLADIVRSAEAEIKAEKAKADAIGLSARAAIELEQRTKLLNDIEKAKIPVTAAVTKEVDRLAKAYADAKIATDVATAIQGVTDSIEKQRTSINDQTNLIGLYGDELTRARIQMEMLTAAQNALPKGVTLSTEDANRVSKAASGQADDHILQDRNRRMETVRKDAEDAMYALDLERKGLGLTGASAEAYAYIVDRLNDAKRAGIELSPDEIRAIEAAGAAYGQARYAIDQQAQAIADAREVTKGFMSDWINGARDGASVFKAFADSVINSLNRIIDKLLDKTLNGFLDSMFSGGGSSGGGLFASIFGGGSAGSKGFVSTGATVKIPDFTKGWEYNPTMNALGGAYGTAQRFAKGGAFTNKIVNTPTLFRFANGAQLGEMGEAGPEAIMPLKRGPNGSLGVQMHGGGRPSMNMTINQEIKLEGAMMPDTVVAVARRAGQEAVDTARLNFNQWAGEWDHDGTVVS